MERQPFGVLCGAVDASLEAALLHQGIGSIDALAALQEPQMRVLAEYGGVRMDSLRSASAAARKRQRRSDGGSSSSSGGGGSRSSSSEEEVANVASEESDYEPSAASPPRKRQRGQQQQQQRQQRQQQQPRAPALHRGGGGGSRTRPRRRNNGLAGVIGSRLAGFFAEQGVHTVEDLSGLEPSFVPAMAAGAGELEDTIHEAIGKAHEVVLGSCTDSLGASGCDDDGSQSRPAAEAGAALGGQADRRRSSRESRKPRDWTKRTSSHGSTRAAATVDPDDLPPCPYAARSNVCWHCDACGVLETLTNKKALAPFHTKHGWTWCNKSTGVEEDGDCFYHCIRLAMGTLHHRPAASCGRVDGGGSSQEVTVKVLRGWVADAATQQTLEHYQAMAAAGIDIEQSEGSLDSDLQAALAASSAMAASGNDGVDLTSQGSASGVGAVHTTAPGDDPDLAAAIAASIVTSSGTEVGGDSGSDQRQLAAGADRARHVGRNDLRQQAQQQEQRRRRRQDDGMLQAGSHRVSRRQAEKRRNASLQDIVGPKLCAVFEGQDMFKVDDVAKIEISMLPDLAAAVNVPEPMLSDAVQKAKRAMRLGPLHCPQQEQQEEDEEEDEDVRHQEQDERTAPEMTVPDDTGMPASPCASQSATTTLMTATTPTQSRSDDRSGDAMSTGRRNRRPPSRWTDDPMTYENLGGSASKQNAIRAKQHKHKHKQKERQQQDEDVLWLDAFRNSTVTDLPSLREYIRREGAIFKGEGCMWADEIAFQVVADRLQLGILFIDINREKDEWPYRVLAMPSIGIKVKHYVVLRLLSAAHYVPLARLLCESEYQPKQDDSEPMDTIATVPAAAAAIVKTPPLETTTSTAETGTAVGDRFASGSGDGDGDGAGAAAAAAAAAGAGAGVAVAASAATVDTPMLAGYAELREKGIECCCFEPTELPAVVKTLWGVHDSQRLLPVHSIANEAEVGGCSGARPGSESTELEAALTESRLMASVEAQKQREQQRNPGEAATHVSPSRADSDAIVLD